MWAVVLAVIVASVILLQFLAPTILSRKEGVVAAVADKRELATATCAPAQPAVARDSSRAAALWRSLRSSYSACTVIDMLQLSGAHALPPLEEVLLPRPSSGSSQPESGRVLLLHPDELELVLAIDSMPDAGVSSLAAQSFEIFRRQLREQAMALPKAGRSFECDESPEQLSLYFDAIEQALERGHLVEHSRVHAVIGAASVELLDESEAQDDHALYPDGINERYQLVVSAARGIEIRAASVFGFQRALASLMQLVAPADSRARPPAISTTSSRTSSAAVRAVHSLPIEIADQPLYRYRGFLIDTGRTYLTLPFIRRIIDSISLLKFNVLHWHLTDDQSFSLEIKSYPQLHLEGGTWLGRLHALDISQHRGRYYTQAEVSELIEYARVRGIRVRPLSGYRHGVRALTRDVAQIVPEIDMPAHARSWSKGYPEIMTKCPKYLNAAQRNINMVRNSHSRAASDANIRH